MLGHDHRTSCRPHARNRVEFLRNAGDIREHGTSPKPRAPKYQMNPKAAGFLAFWRLGARKRTWGWRPRPDGSRRRRRRTAQAPDRALRAALGAAAATDSQGRMDQRVA